MQYRGPDILSELEAKIEAKRSELEHWFAEKRSEMDMPIYGSVDIRDAHWKVAVVDANQYPAGFNNLREGDIGEHFREAIGDLRHIHIWPEKLRKNSFTAFNWKSCCRERCKSSLHSRDGLLK